MVGQPSPIFLPFIREVKKQRSKDAKAFYQKPPGSRVKSKYLVKYGACYGQVFIPPAPERAEMHQVDIKGLEVSEVKSFGPEHLCKQVAPSSMRPWPFQTIFLQTEASIGKMFDYICFGCLYV